MALQSADIQLLAGLNLQSSEQEILKAIQILQKNLQANQQAKIKLDVQIDQVKFQQIVSTLQQLSKRSDLSMLAQQSIANITKEATQLTAVAKATEQVIKEKKELATVNDKVAKSAKDAETTMSKQISRMNMGASGVDVQNMVTNLHTMNNTATHSNSIFGNLKNAISNTFSSGKLAMTSYLAVLRSINTAARDAKEAIVELNQAETDLMIATNMSRESVKGLIKDYNRYGKQLASTTTQITESADDYLRAGKDLKESQALIKDSIMLSKLGQIDSDEATEDLLATINGYNMAVEQVDSALDAMVAIDMKAATSAGDLATGLKYSASSANAAGLEFNKLVAMLGTVQDKTQQTAQVVGTFANTILSRYRDITIGKYLSDDGEDISNYESVLKSVGIELRDNAGEFRAFEVVLEEMAGKWDSLTSVQQNALIKVAAGTRQQNRFIALMENYNKVLELTEVAANSAGTAVEKFNNSYMTSLEAKQNTLQASFESMIYNVNLDEVYGDILDATTAIVEFIDKANLLKGVMTGLTVGAGIKGFLALKSGIHSAYISLNQFQNALNMVKQMNISNKDFKTLLLLTNGLSDSQTKLLLSTKNLNFQQKQQILIAQGLSAEEAKLKLQSWGLASAQTGLTASTTSLKVSLQGLFATMMTNPIFLIIAGVTTAVSAFTSYQNKLEEVRQITVDAATAYQESSKSIDDYISRYQELQKALQDAKGDEEATATVKQQLLDLQMELNDTYGDEYCKLNLVTDAYKDQTEAIKELSKAEANRYLNENREGIATATKKISKEKDYILTSGTVTSYSSKGKALQEVADSYADQGLTVEKNSVTSAMELKITADAQTAYDVINNFESDLRAKAIELGNEHLFDEVLKVSSKALNKAKGVVDEYGDIYNQALMAQLVTNEPMSAVYNEALNAVDTYNQAVAESENPYNDSKVAEAKQNLDEVKAKINGNLIEWDKYSAITGDLFAQANTSLIDFNERLTTDTSLQSWANQLKGLSQTELLSMADDGAEDAFDKLIGSAEEYGLSVNDVIDALVRLGYVQSDVITASDALTYNVVDLDNLNDQVDSIQSAYKGLTSACEEYNRHGYITADTLQTLLNLDGQYLACLMNENGQLAINRDTYQALVQAKLADAEAIAVQQAIEELGTVTTEQQIQADTTAIGVMAEKGTALATLTGQYASLANVAVSAAQAQALADAYTDASSKNQEEADRIMSNLNAKLALIQNTATSTSGSFGALTNHLNGFSDASGNAKSATDELTDSLKKQKSVLEDTKSELDELYDGVRWFYETKQDAINDKIDDLKELNKQLENQKNNLDDVISAMSLVYDSEIKKLEAKRDALDDVNEAAELELRIEQAKQKLREAKSRKNVLQYQKDKGFVYVQSEKDIAEAESELDEANAEKIKQGIQDQIDLIQSYKDKLADIPKAYEQSMQKIAALKYLGADWQTAILNPSDDLFENLEKDYTGIQGNISLNDSKIDSLEAEKERIQELMKLWENAKNQYKYQNYEAQLASFFGSDYEYQLLHNSSTWRKKFAAEYADVCMQIEQIEKRIKSVSEETTSSVSSNAERATTALKGTKDTLENMKTVSTYMWTAQDDIALAFAEQRLSHLNNRIAEGATGLTDAQSKVQKFVDEYSRLEESGNVTDNLTSSIEDLNSVSNYTGVYFGNMIAGVSDRLADMSNYTDKVVMDTQLTVDSMNVLDTAMQSVKVSETAIETEANITATELDTTITDILTKIETLKTSLTELTNYRQMLETVMNQEIFDSATVITDSQTKVEEIKTSMTSLLEVIVLLETSLLNLTTQISALDAVTLQNLISQVGLSAEEDAASGLLGALKQVLLLLNGEETGLLYLLQTLNSTPLDTLIAEFNGEEASLLSSINQVKAAIYTEDGECLINTINQITETISNIEQVTSAFGTMHIQISGCVEQVKSLKDAIDALEDKTITITTVVQGGDIPGFAKGTRKAPKGIAEVAEEGAEIISNGETAVIAPEHTLVNLQGGETIYPADVTERILAGDGLTELSIDGLTKAGLTEEQYGQVMHNRAMSMIMNGLDFSGSNTATKLPKLIQHLQNIPESKVTKNISVTIGDIHNHNIQNTDQFAKEIKYKLGNIVTQEINRRDT